MTLVSEAMRSSRRLRTGSKRLWALALIAAAASGTIAAGQDAPAPGAATARATPDARLAQLRAQAERYRLRIDPAGSQAVVLHPEPLLRWTNPVADEEDAVLFLWTRDGHPEATAQFFVRGDNWMHEFQSLSLQPFRAEWGGAPVWSPAGPGVEFRALLGAPAPADSAAQRLRQMRAIAESFRASVEFEYADKSHYELRLLPRPVYRYGGGGAETVDGTLWVYAQGTNPEVLLLIEARTNAEKRLEWQYAPAPMTSYAAELSRNGRRVWEIGRREVPSRDPSSGYFFRYRVPPV